MKAMYELDGVKEVYDSRTNSKLKVIRTRYGYFLKTDYRKYTGIKISDLKYLSDN